MGGEGREELIHHWSPHLPNYVDSTMSLLPPAGGHQGSVAGSRSNSEVGLETSSNESEADEEELSLLSG